MAAANEVNNFEPSSDLIQEEECDTLLVYLPGFTKEQLRVQLTKSGLLRISGMRPIGDTKWSSFQKEFPVSANIDNNKISAKFEGGILYVRQPKLIVPAKKEEQTVPPPSETPQPQTPAQEQQAPPKNDQEHADNQNKKSSSAKEEGKSNKEEKKSSETEDMKRDERKHEQQKKDKKDDLKDAARSKHENDAELANKAKVDASKLVSGSPAAKLKMVRQQMTAVLAVLFAFALGIYISNLGWFSRKAEN